MVSTTCSGLVSGPGSDWQRGAGLREAKGKKARTLLYLDWRCAPSFTWRLMLGPVRREAGKCHCYGLRRFDVGSTASWLKVSCAQAAFCLFVVRQLSWRPFTQVPHLHIGPRLDTLLSFFHSRPLMSCYSIAPIANSFWRRFLQLQFMST